MICIEISAIHLITLKSFLLRIILVCGTDSNSSPILEVMNTNSILQMQMLRSDLHIIKTTIWW